MSDLRISPDLTLPVDAMTEAIAILATRGRGKTNLATVVAEELLKQRQQVVIVDPVGIYWGLRSSADGKAEGLRILVLGGQHGDLPLAAADAGAIAGFLVEKEASAVLDLSAFPSKGEQTRFLEVFFERLWHLKAAHRSPMLLVLEEAQEVAPQRPREKEQIMLGRIERIAKLGRNYGIGLLMITQRPASLNKDVLNLAGVLILLGIVAPIERKSAMDWISAHEVQAQADQVLASLAKLPVGDAWLWWPLRDLLTRFHVRKRETFDSSATPKVGEKRVEPGRRAAIDLDAYKNELGAMIEKQKADDPAELRKKIRELEQQLTLERKHPLVKVETVEVQVPAVVDVGELRGIRNGIQADVERLTIAIERLGEASVAKSVRKPTVGATPEFKPSRSVPVVRDGLGEAVARARASTVDRSTMNGELTGPQRRVLDALAWLQEVGFDEPTKIQVGFIAGYRVSKRIGGAFGNILGQLRSLDHIDYPEPGRVRLTDTGAVLSKAPGIERTSHGLQEAVYQRLDGPEARVLRVIVAAYPGSLPKTVVAERANYQINDRVGGTFGNILGRLRSLGLIDYPAPGSVKAEPVLFLE